MMFLHIDEVPFRLECLIKLNRQTLTSQPQPLLSPSPTSSSSNPSIETASGLNYLPTRKNGTETKSVCTASIFSRRRRVASELYGCP